jgi:guanine deaminase
MWAMEQAINAAKEGLSNHGGPFGASIAFKERLLAVAHNTVLCDKDPTAHAEINVIRLAAKELGTHILADCTLYTTSEPCPMCLAAIYWARIPRVFVGVTTQVAASFGFDDQKFYQELKRDAAQRTMKIETGILADACEALFQEWKNNGGIVY